MLSPSVGHMSDDPLAAVLALQDHDTTSDQLRHRRQGLPERAAVAAVDANASALLARRKAAQAARDEAAAALGIIERDLGTVEARIKEVDKRLYGGEVTASRDLSAMADEVGHLKKRQSHVEDAALEAMEVLAPLEEELAAMQAELSDVARLRQERSAALLAAEAEMDAALAAHEPVRPGLAAAIAPDLLARYELLRARFGGVGAARLANGSCTGCHLALAATEIEKLRKTPRGTVPTCEECGRILVP